MSKNTAQLLLILWYAMCWSWTLSTDSLSLSGSHTQGIVIAAAVSLVNVTLSTVIMWQGIRFARTLIATRKPIIAIPISVIILALSDFLVAWLTALIWIGPQGSFDNILPLGSPTLVLINTPFGFASRIVGFFGLAAFVWLIVILMTNKSTRRPALATTVILALISVIGWLAYRTPTGTSFTAIIISETLDERLSALDTSDSKLVIFPEYGLDSISNINLQTRLFSKSDKSYFVGSQEQWQPNEASHRNTLLFGNTQQGITQNQNKHRLIPGGEDLPYSVKYIMQATKQNKLLSYFTFHKAVIKNPSQLQPSKIDSSTSIGAAVCSSIIAPQDYRQFTKAGATVLSNSASLQVFGGTLVFNRQQKSLGKFMAVANARYFLQSANGDRAYALDINGRTIAEEYAQNSARVTVQNNTRKTPYTVIGEWMVWLGAVVSVSMILSSIFRRPVSTKGKLTKSQHTKK